jgi:hypothetical protein
LEDINKKAIYFGTYSKWTEMTQYNTGMQWGLQKSPHKNIWFIVYNYFMYYS